MDLESDIRFLIGSKVFFSCYTDFNPHDEDVLILQKANPKYKEHTRICIKNVKCVIYWKQFTPEKYIEIHLRDKIGLQLGKFLVPEFVNYIGFTIDNLKLLQPLLAHLDDKHKYEESIYNSYIENNDFILTDELRLNAYKLYKEKRNL